MEVPGRHLGLETRHLVDNQPETGRGAAETPVKSGLGRVAAGEARALVHRMAAAGKLAELPGEIHRPGQKGASSVPELEAEVPWGHCNQAVVRNAL